MACDSGGRDYRATALARRGRSEASASCGAGCTCVGLTHALRTSCRSPRTCVRPGRFPRRWRQLGRRCPAGASCGGRQQALSAHLGASRQLRDTWPPRRGFLGRGETFGRAKTDPRAGRPPLPSLSACGFSTAAPVFTDRARPQVFWHLVRGHGLGKKTEVSYSFTSTSRVRKYIALQQHSVEVSLLVVFDAK